MSKIGRDPWPGSIPKERAPISASQAFSERYALKIRQGKSLAITCIELSTEDARHLVAAKDQELDRLREKMVQLGQHVVNFAKRVREKEELWILLMASPEIQKIVDDEITRRLSSSTSTPSSLGDVSSASPETT